jgi:hypothetical protein
LPRWLIASIGPKPPLAPSLSAAVQLHRTGHSCAAQHFGSPNDGMRTKLPLDILIRMSASGTRVKTA